MSEASVRRCIAVASCLMLALVSCSDDGQTPSLGPAKFNDYQHLKWHKDGSVTLITYEDREEIHVPVDQIGTLFKKGKQPFTGRNITINVVSGGPKGGISGALVRLRPAWEELSGAKIDIVEIPIAEQLNKTIADIRFGGKIYDGLVQGAWYMGELVTRG